MLAPVSARALYIAAPMISVTPGSTGEFEIPVYNDGFMVSPTYDITGFNFTLTATSVAATGFSFTGVTDSTTPDAYIFPGSTTFSGSATAGSLTASDSDSTGFTVIAPGDTFGLAEVSYSVAAVVTPGAYTLTFSNTSVYEEGGTDDLSDVPGLGTVTVTPEPGSLALCGFAVIGALTFGYIRARGSSQQA